MGKGGSKSSSNVSLPTLAEARKEQVNASGVTKLKRVLQQPQLHVLLVVAMLFVSSIVADNVAQSVSAGANAGGLGGSLPSLVRYTISSVLEAVGAVPVRV
mmetsp:Transcript_7159/g.15304  ORF Transcript_7159/g.15304 Transcript_7159/m.15304 type:complete len:101 (-) Transcript_7159:101-403(-)|eukprot:CAMPEP_0185849420 /NCGR_PEP_ID=MMETSP1354-20130828/3923_1 /TAXON_ID=708628 /ORGANISM="Erythrolobus madagascarensis, Strain CCMP3276" /LENGTH=100 /DNA_ID=CAMNT_0028549937 /DNA_START=61 /DNA_END=363 /DNA_ORIENTATION=+